MIFFTSDHHFGHSNIIKYCNRPFKSVDEMNEEMVNRWNEVVEKDDIVYYLGDFSLSIKAVEQYLPRLNGNKYLIMGNHDQCHPCHGKKSDWKKVKYFELGWGDIGEFHYVNIEGNEVKLHHMPYKDDTDQRFTEYRPFDKGNWLLHGHVHNKWKVKDKMINVGVDVWDFYPVSIDKIKELIK